MRPPLWHPPVELSTAEYTITKRIRRAKLFVFLRQHRHELFADPFQQELLLLYKDQPQAAPLQRPTPRPASGAACPTGPGDSPPSLYPSLR